MSTYRITTKFYVPNLSIHDSAVIPVAGHLKSHGWEVPNIDCPEFAYGLFTLEYLSQWHPADVTISRAGATIESARKAVEDAIHAVGCYSVGENLVGNVLTIADGIAASADPDAPTSPLLSTLQYLAMGVCAVAVVAVVVVAAPLIRTATDAAKVAA